MKNKYLDEEIRNKSQDAEEINNLTEVYLRNGGKITYCPIGKCSEEVKTINKKHKEAKDDYYKYKKI